MVPVRFKTAVEHFGYENGSIPDACGVVRGNKKRLRMCDESMRQAEEIKMRAACVMQRTRQFTRL